MSRIRVFLAALALTSGFTVGAIVGVDVQPAAASSISHDCNVARWSNPSVGLVCYDKSMHLFAIWTPFGGWWGQFYSNGGGTVTTPVGTWGPYNWTSNWNQTWTSGNEFVTTSGNCLDGGPFVCVNSPQYHDVLEWFAADNAYVLTVRS